MYILVFSYGLFSSEDWESSLEHSSSDHISKPYVEDLFFSTNELKLSVLARWVHILLVAL